jgi:hypothetical protein
MSEESALERFSRKGRRVLAVTALIVVVVAGGGLAIALQVGPLPAVAFVVVASALVGFVFPRLV